MLRTARRLSAQLIDVLTVNIFLNGEDREVPDEATIAQLLAVLELRSEQVAVEVNADLVPRDQHAAYVLNPGDELELVTLVGGG